MTNLRFLNSSSLPQSPVVPSSSIFSCQVLTPSSAATNNNQKLLLTMGPCSWRNETGSLQCTCTSGSVLILAAIGSQITPRGKVVDELIARVHYFHIVRVNGTPASGKTTLMNLTVNKLLEYYPATPIYRISGWERESVCNANGWAAHLEAQTGIHGHQLLTHRAYLLLDEAQESYWDGELWADLFKAVEPASQVHIILFMSYGSPTRGFNGFSQKKYVKTPMIFSMDQQISLKPDENIEFPWKPVGLLLDEDEVYEVVDRYVPTFIPDCRAILTQDLKQGFFLTSSGHVGLLTSLTHALAVFPALYKIVRSCQPITWSITSEALFTDPERFFNFIDTRPFARGLPPQDIIQKYGPASVLKVAIACDGIYKSSFENKSAELKEALENLWINGWLHAEKSDGDVHFVFPSQIHRWYCQYLFSEKHPDNELGYGSPLQLALDAIKSFQPCQLSDAPQYVIKAGTKGGTIDFLVAQKKWGLELLRDRDRLLQHMQRFKQNGQYFSMIEQGKMEQYIVLDFTNKTPQKSHPEFQDHLYHVVFSENYRTVRVINADLSEVNCFVLMENGTPVH
ncbi:hypothetical protein BDW59DRAFT_169350 [Aspergillus cavernicola]|uniref:AAA domain-containing protein n=1 Tax=Aspergillus cavernicola TaxID=176166 RepID=A0ABR4IXH7_9EURO